MPSLSLGLLLIIAIVGLASSTPQLSIELDNRSHAALDIMPYGIASIPPRNAPNKDWILNPSSLFA